VPVYKDMLAKVPIILETRRNKRKADHISILKGYLPPPDPEDREQARNDSLMQQMVDEENVIVFDREDEREEGSDSMDDTF